MSFVTGRTAGQPHQRFRSCLAFCFVGEEYDVWSLSSTAQLKFDLVRSKSLCSSESPSAPELSGIICRHFQLSPSVLRADFIIVCLFVCCYCWCVINFKSKQIQLLFVQRQPVYLLCPPSTSIGKVPLSESKREHFFSS